MANSLRFTFVVLIVVSRDSALPECDFLCVHLTCGRHGPNCLLREMPMLNNMAAGLSVAEQRFV
jgi:hypothetical protein